MCPNYPSEHSTELINVENGFLNVRTRQLFPHSPSFTSCPPFAFQSHSTHKASCPELDRFELARTNSGRHDPLTWKILGDLLNAGPFHVQKAIWLLSEGREP